MPGDSWDVDLDDEAMKARLRAFATLLLDLRPFWPKVVPLFIGWMNEQFASQGAWWGTPWAPLSPEYAMWKAVHYPGKGILVAAGDLRREASMPARRATQRTLTLSIRWRKAPKPLPRLPRRKPGEPPRPRRSNPRRVLDPRWHQLGTDRMPARPLLGEPLPLEAQLELDAAAEDYVREMAQRVGLPVI